MDLMREQMLRNGSIGPRDEQQAVLDKGGRLVWRRQVQQFCLFMTSICVAVTRCQGRHCKASAWMTLVQELYGSPLTWIVALCVSNQLLSPSERRLVRWGMQVLTMACDLALSDNPALP